MGYPTCMTDVQNVGAGLFVDIQPPVDESWRLTEIGSDQMVGVQPNILPDVTVSLFDGVNQGNFLLGANTRGWYRRQNLCIDNVNYIRLTNTNAAGADLCWSATLIAYFGAGTSTVRSDVQNVGIGLVVDIQPPVDEDHVVYDFGSDQWLGAAPNGVPNVEVDLVDGLLVARIMDSTEIRQWEAEQKLYINNTVFLRLTNASLAAADLCWSSELLQDFGTGASIVRSDVQACGAGLNVDFQPPLGEEWTVTMIASSVWVGISPAQFPDITAFVFDGAIASQIQTPTSWRNNGNQMKLHINNGNYLRVNDAGAAGQNVGISAVLTQRYA